MEHLQPQHERSYADVLDGSMLARKKELRGKTADRLLRVAIASNPTRAATLLAAGDKSGVRERQFYRELIATVEALLDGHLERIRSQKNGKDE